MTQYSIDDLITLMARLRDPDDGCPWDLKQDFASIVPHTLEEAYEVADTIERQDWTHLKDELGDLLFQVVFYARLGEETGYFDFDAIVDNLTSKLIRRHPHVFPAGSLDSRAGDQQRSEAQIRETWEAIKQQERDDKEKGGVLDDVPLSLPALSRAAKLQKRAALVGFDWPEALQVLDKIEEEVAELRDAIARGAQTEIRDELGDLIFAQVNLARHLDVEPEAALRGTNAKFVRRFAHIERSVEASGRQWQDFTLGELDALWNEAKAKGL